MATITLTDFSNRKIIQRNVATQNRSVTISGVCSGATSIEARVVNDGTSTEVVGWTQIDAAPTATFSGNLTVPQGGWYNVQVRVGNDHAVVSNGTNKFGVGMVILFSGQSQAYTYTKVAIDSSIAGDDRTGVWVCMPSYPGQTADYYDNTVTYPFVASSLTYYSPANDKMGATYLANQLVATYGIPVCIVQGATGYTTTDEWINTGSYIYYQSFKDAAAKVNSECEFILWNQGEKDADIPHNTAATYKNNVVTINGRMRTDITNMSSFANIPFLVVGLGTRLQPGWTAGQLANNDIWYDNIRQGQALLESNISNCYYVGQEIGLPFTDTVHINQASMVVMSDRIVQTIGYLYGRETWYKEPYIYSAVALSSTTVKISISHIGGNDITPTTGNVKGFRVWDGATELSVVSAYRDATSILLTLSSPSSSVLTIKYLYGANPLYISNTSGAGLTSVPYYLDNSPPTHNIKYNQGITVNMSAIATGRNNLLQTSNLGRIYLLNNLN